MSDPDRVHVERIGPDPRLLVVLVGIVVTTALAMVLFGSGTTSAPVSIGSLPDIVERTSAGPLELAELPHIVVSRAPTPNAVFDARWSSDTGSLLLDPDTQLVALELRDPVDGASLRWCRSSGAFQHPEGLRTYGRAGELLRGDGPRGMDRRAIHLAAGGEVVVDDGRWVQGLPRGDAYGVATLDGPPCP